MTTEIHFKSHTVPFILLQAQGLGNAKHPPVTRYGVRRGAFADGLASITTALPF
jgi:hypothetical protein